MDVFDFSTCALLVKQRCKEELRKSIQSFVETCIVGIEVIVGCCHCGECVPGTCVSLKELFPLIRLVEHFRSLEKHVLHKLCSPLEFFWVMKTTDLDFN